MLQFQNGNTTCYLYSNDGVKRKVTHQTAIANIVVPMGSIQPLASGQIAYTSTNDYCGNIIYEDGILSKILTEEGYITLSGTTSTYHYHLKDYLGNNRVVMDQSGTVEQVDHYYPFGGLFGEGTATTNQAYKYNGALKGEAPQYTLSMRNPENIATQLGGAELTFTGQSLGGELAAANAMATGKDAIAFNAAGVSNKTIEKINLSAGVNIDACVVKGEIC